MYAVPPQYRHLLATSDASSPTVLDARKQHLSRVVGGNAVLIHDDKRDEHERLVGKVMAASPDACPGARSDCPKNLDAGQRSVTMAFLDAASGKGPR